MSAVSWCVINISCENFIPHFFFFFFPADMPIRVWVSKISLTMGRGWCGRREMARRNIYIYICVSRHPLNHSVHRAASLWEIWHRHDDSVSVITCNILLIPAWLVHISGRSIHAFSFLASFKLCATPQEDLIEIRHFCLVFRIASHIYKYIKAFPRKQFLPRRLHPANMNYYGHNCGLWWLTAAALCVIFQIKLYPCVQSEAKTRLFVLEEKKKMLQVFIDLLT